MVCCTSLSAFLRQQRFGILKTSHLHPRTALCSPGRGPPHPERWREGASRCSGWHLPSQLGVPKTDRHSWLSAAHLPALFSLMCADSAFSLPLVSQ